METTSAFPHPDGQDLNKGITKLEYFTAAALTGLLASQDPEHPANRGEIANKAISMARVTLEFLAEEEK